MIVTLHGIGEGAPGYSHQLRDLVAATARDHGVEPPEWREICWGTDHGADWLDGALDLLRGAADPSYYDDALSQLRSVLAAYDDVVVVAHSLGAVVAARAVAQGARPKAVVTIGAPLALPFYSAERHSLRYGETRWVSVRDPLDPVCLGDWSDVEDDRVVKLAFSPLGAHAAYWRSRLVAQWVIAEEAR